jgi:hypothetical protein
MGVIFYLPLDKILDVHIRSLPTTHSPPQVKPVIQAILLLPKHDFSKLNLQKWKSMRQCRLMPGIFALLCLNVGSAYWSILSYIYVQINERKICKRLCLDKGTGYWNLSIKMVTVFEALTSCFYWLLMCAVCHGGVQLQRVRQVGSSINTSDLYSGDKLCRLCENIDRPEVSSYIPYQTWDTTLK